MKIPKSKGVDLAEMYHVTCHNIFLIIYIIFISDATSGRGVSYG